MNTFTSRPRAALALLLFSTALATAGCDRRTSDMQTPTTTGSGDNNSSTPAPGMSGGTGTVPGSSASAPNR